MASGNNAYTAENGVLYNKNKTTLIQYPIGKTGSSFDIPNSVTNIGVSAFRTCANLTSITIPVSVTNIGIYAFSLCTSLTSITIPVSVTSIAEYAFLACSNLTSVTFEGTIASSNFSSKTPFPGDLRDKYLAGGTGTYKRSKDYSTWTKTSGGNLGIELVFLANDNGDFAVEAKLDATQWANVTDRSKYKEVLQQISISVYAKFKDDFDFIFFVLNTEDYAIGNALGFAGTHIRVSNNVTGLGIEEYSNAPIYGSDEKLKSLMYFPSYDSILLGPALHEIAHKWAAYICPTYTLGNTGDVRYDGHWGISNAGGQLGGAKYIREIQTFSDGTKEYQGSMDGTFTDGFVSNANGGNGLVYSDIELYTMGMIGADELKRKGFQLDIYSGLSPSDKNSVEEKRYGYFKATTIKSYTIDDLISLNGPRVPDASASQKSFKVLTVILSNNQDTTASTRYDKIVKDVKWFAGLHQDTDNWKVYNFKEATGGKGSLIVGDIKKSLKP